MAPRVPALRLDAAALEALVRPRAWPKLALPLLAGVAASWSTGANPEPTSVGLLGLFLVGDAALIFASNDLVDEEADRVRRKHEPTATRKALLDGVVSRRAMATAALLGLSAVLAAGHLLTRRTGHTAPTVVAMAAVLCVVLYEFAPFRLNYRGGGEVVEALGVGAILPLMGVSVGPAGCPRSLLAILPTLSALALAGSIASTLADARADEEAGKRTFAVRFGPRGAAHAIAVSVSVASVLALFASLLARPSTALVAIAVGAGVGAVLRTSRAWDGFDVDGLVATKRAVGRLLRSVWIAAAVGFVLDRVLA